VSITLEAVLFLFSRCCSGEASRKGNDIARVRLRKMWRDESATSKPEPFLHKPQKRFGTPRVSIAHGFSPVPRGRAGHPPPREFQSCMGSLRCRAEGLATRPTRSPKLLSPPNESSCLKRRCEYASASLR
jgi:hypothetical protein